MKLPACWCDSHGMVYDSKRDRMVFSSIGGSYEKGSNGTYLAYDFKTATLSPISPANAELNKTHTGREMAYLDHADCILTGELWPRSEEKNVKRYTRVYDCAKNACYLLDAGPVADRHSCGWMYDAKRKLAYVLSYRGEVWAMRFEPKTAKLREKVPAE